MKFPGRNEVILWLGITIAISLNALGQTPEAPAGRFGSIRWADKFPGSTPSAQINAATADCGPDTGAAGKGCLVIIPSTLGCGEPNQAPDNVLLWDLRGCAQSQGLRFNVSRSASGHVRSKVLLQDNFTVKTVAGPPPLSSATLYVHSLPDSANHATGSLAAINGTINTNTLTGDFSGNLIGIEGEAFATLTDSSPHNVRDVRGGTFNTLVGQGVHADGVTSLYAQAPIVHPGGSIKDSVSLRAEAPKGGTEMNLAGWFNGDVKVDTKLSVGEGLTVGSGSAISKVVLAKKSLDFGQIAANSCAEKSIPVQDVSSTGTASASPAASLGDVNLFWSAWVSGAGTVSVRLCNVSGSPKHAASSTWNVTVIQ